VVALAGSSSELPRVILPVPVDAELELNSVIPPPDTIEEDERKKNEKKRSSKVKDLRTSRVALQSTQSAK
jgi:hypothetical protein